MIDYCGQDFSMTDFWQTENRWVLIYYEWVIYAQIILYRLPKHAFFFFENEKVQFTIIRNTCENKINGKFAFMVKLSE